MTEKREPKLAQMQPQLAEEMFARHVEYVNGQKDLKAFEKTIELVVAAGALGFGENPKETSKFVAGVVGKSQKTVYAQWNSFACDGDYEQGGWGKALTWPCIKMRFELFIAQMTEGERARASFKSVSEIVAEELGCSDYRGVQKIVIKFDKDWSWRKSLGFERWQRSINDDGEDISSGL